MVAAAPSFSVPDVPDMIIPVVGGFGAASAAAAGERALCAPECLPKRLGPRAVCNLRASRAQRERRDVWLAHLLWRGRLRLAQLKQARYAVTKRGKGSRAPLGLEDDAASQAGC